MAERAGEVRLPVGDGPRGSGWRRWAEVVLYGLRRRRRLVSLGAVALSIAVAYPAAFLVHFGRAWDPAYNATILFSAALLTGLRLLAADACGLSAHRWRFVGPEEVRRLIVAVLLGTALFVPLSWWWGFFPPIPPTVLVLEPLFTLVLTAGLWLAYRTAMEKLLRARESEDGPSRKFVVVGAGEAGEALVRQTIIHPTGYRAVAFVDDDPSRIGTSIHGVRVMGSTLQLDGIVESTGADEIVIAVPSADPADLRRIVDRCEPARVPFRVLPGIAEVLDGDISLAQLREVQIEDLLGREPVDIKLPELARDMAGECVLITGAAGSIGSELARQCMRNRPAQLVLLDQSETALFYLQEELREENGDVCLVPVIADVVDAGSVNRVFGRYRPSRVFHAAAYKHVPMMESNVREALRNNIVGTWRVAAAAGRHGVKKFVLVSTDKAVRPANVMGATKRVAEIVVLELQTKYPDTAFSAVRFGNVLGSAGSVIPVFKRQLEEGRPLTVTDPKATRYFMTIPEAAQLVLQASLLHELRGRVAMLDMGEPVRILDLARTLLRLAGGGGTREAIVFTGLRPGEKLHEELVAPGERSTQTEIPKVRVLEPNGASSNGVLSRVARWERKLVEWRVEEVVMEMKAALPEIADGLAASDPPRAPAREAAAPGRNGAVLHADKGNGSPLRVHRDERPPPTRIPRSVPLPPPGSAASDA